MSVSRLLLRVGSDRFEAIDSADIYYAEADGGDTVVRTRRKRPYRTTEHLAQLAERLSSDAAFVRIHRSYLIRLDRVREVRRRGENDWEVKLEPPVNVVLPIARKQVAGLFRKVGWS